MLLTIDTAKLLESLYAASDQEAAFTLDIVIVQQGFSAAGT